MSDAVLQVRPDTYIDSVVLMAASRAMYQASGVEWAAAVMGTPANVEVLVAEGFDRADLDEVGANDVVLAVRAGSSEECDEAFRAADAALSEEGGEDRPGRSRATLADHRPRTLEEASSFLSRANLAIVSVPGPYAALEAHKALSDGLHVLLFSDNVPVADEVELKTRAEDMGLLVMGPGAGTAMLGGVGLGFANVVRRGSVGIAAAAGTGAQEVMSLLDRWGAGVSQVVGVGGRDLSHEVGGRMMRLALNALQDDPATEVLVVVSKPPDPEVAGALLAGLGDRMPAVVALIGLEEQLPAGQGTILCSTMEEAVLATLALLGLSCPDPAAGLASLLAGAHQRLSPERRAIRGLFSGGTLCYESLTILARRLGPIYSNTPLKKAWGLPAPAGSHICLDLGEEEYTRGRPHPMIDPEPRAEQLIKEGTDPATAVILIDVVLGYGSHPDPASILAPACAEVTSRAAGPAVVAYVLGTERDPQDYARQRQLLQEAGCLLAPTGATAARMAAALVSDRHA